MDVIEASHLEIVKQFLTEHPEYEFKARKYKDHWLLNLNEYDGTVHWQMSGPTFGEAAKSLAHSLYIWNQTNTGVENDNRSTNER